MKQEFQTGQQVSLKSTVTEKQNSNVSILKGRSPKVDHYATIEGDRIVYCYINSIGAGPELYPIPESQLE